LLLFAIAMGIAIDRILTRRKMSETFESERAPEPVEAFPHAMRDFAECGVYLRFARQRKTKL
jgi:hypothetical protein